MVHSEVAMSFQIAVLEESFREVTKHGDEFAAAFYERLFRQNPELAPLFAHVDMFEQYHKLLTSLVMIIQNLKHPEILGSALSALGKRHAGYHVRPEYYPLLGAALVASIGEYVGDQWTPAVRLAWEEAYADIANMMLAPEPLRGQTIALPARV